MNTKSVFSLTSFSFRTIYTSAIAAVLALSSCSSSEPAPQAEVPDASAEISSIELYISRASLNLTEFEQFKFENSKLFKECGALRAGRHVPRAQEFVSVKNDSQLEIINRATKLLSSAKTSTSQTEAPGTNAHFADPGQFYLTIKFKDQEYQLKTSLDAVINSDTALQAQALKLARELRTSAGVPLCDNLSFYGVQPLR